MTIAEVLNTEGSIQNFFRRVTPSEGATYGIQPETMETYIKSCGKFLHTPAIKINISLEIVDSLKKP